MIHYGIATSEAHYWAHICPLDGVIYWYPRGAMIGVAMACPEIKIRSAIGRVVPIVKNLFVNRGIIRYTDVGYPFMEQWDFAAAESDRGVGKLAEKCFSAACKARLILLPVRVAKYYDSTVEQYKGKDFCVDLGAGAVDVEVKYDGPGGTWGTGNLFVQTHEGTSHDGDKHDATARNGHRVIVPALRAHQGA